MDPEEVLKELEKKKIRPVYLLHGDEYFYTREIILALRQQVLQGGDASMCLSEYDGPNVTVAEVLDDLRTMTFFGGMRLVIVENADGFMRDNKEVLARYAQSPAETGCLVLVCDRKPDGRWVLVQAVSKNGAMIACEAPRGGRIFYWIRARATQHGKTLGRSASGLLLDIVGGDLAKLDSHLKMLATYVGKRKSITEEDVATAVGEEKTVQVWDLMDGIASKNGKMALEALDRLLPRVNMETARLSLIGTTLLNLRNVKKLMERLGSEAKVVRALKMHPYAAKKNIEHAGKFSGEELELGIRKALEADILIKSSRMTPRLAVEKLIVELCK